MSKSQEFTKYFMQFDESGQQILEAVYEAIKSVVPTASETIAYGMPTFYLNGNLVHFALYKNHLGFYPAPSGITNFEKELASYQTSKGAIKFPLDDVPYDLIKKITAFRASENERKE